MSGDNDVFKSWDESQWKPTIPRDRYEITDTGQEASYSMRSLFKVVCTKCGQVLTEFTTAPDRIVEYHEMDTKHDA